MAAPAPATDHRRGARPIAPRSFVLCADDYALAPGVSRGILEALNAGALSATSAMTNGADWPGAAGLLRPFVGRADLGLHLTLTCGRSLTPMPRFAPSGELPTLRELLRGSRGGTLPAEEIEREIEAQAEAFSAAMGRPPDHVDGHQHVHVLPAVRRALLAVLSRRRWHPWLRDSGDAPSRILRRRSASAKALGLTVLARGLRRQARAAHLATNQGFAGYSHFDARDDYAIAFARYVVAPGPRHLVMCHPGYVDDALRRRDPVLETREQELRFLLSPSYRILLDRVGMTPSRMNDI